MIGVDEEGLAIVEVKNRFGVGDTIEVIHPEGNRMVPLQRLYSGNLAGGLKSPLVMVSA